MDVAARLEALLQRVVAAEHVLLLVAHGDTLQILQALLAQGEADANAGTRGDAVLASHRRFAMNTGELRLVVGTRLVA